MRVKIIAWFLCAALLMSASVPALADLQIVSEGKSYVKTDDGLFRFHAFAKITNTDSQPASLYGVAGMLNLSAFGGPSETVFESFDYTLPARMVPQVLQPGQTGYIEWTVEFPDNGLYDRVTDTAGDTLYSFDPLFVSFIITPDAPEQETAELDVIDVQFENMAGVELGAVHPLWKVNVTAINNSGKMIVNPEFALCFGRDEGDWTALDEVVFISYKGLAIPAGESMTLTFNLDDEDLPDVLDLFADYDDASDLIGMIELLDVAASGECGW